MKHSVIPSYFNDLRRPAGGMRLSAVDGGSSVMISVDAVSEGTLRRRDAAATAHQILARARGDFTWLTGNEGRSVILAYLARRFPPQEIPTVAAQVCQRKLTTREFLASCQRNRTGTGEHDPLALVGKLRTTIFRYRRARPDASNAAVADALRFLASELEEQ